LNYKKRNNKGEKVVDWGQKTSGSVKAALPYEDDVILKNLAMQQEYQFVM